MTSLPKVLSETVSASTFEQLCELWQQIRQPLGAVGMLVTPETFPRQSGDRPFYFLLNSGFAALLLGQPQAESQVYDISFSVDIPYISDFFREFPDNHGAHSLILEILAKLQSLSSNSLNSFSNNFFCAVFNLIYSTPNPQVCQPIENALFKQIQQERLINQVVSQIHQSLELPIVLQTAVLEVRKFLEVDRLIIYEFTKEANVSEHFYEGKGRVSYEAIASDSISSILNLEAEDSCFSSIPKYREKYSKGNIVAVEDVEAHYSSSFCLAEFLNSHHVRSKLVAPIVVQDELWGLIIAHQCYQTRTWESSEIQLLGYIGEHLAIAIYQAELYSQVQQQKNLFEQRVIERTQELHDTMIAAEAANISKHEFLSNMSHELLTPLTCIIGLSGTLQRWSSAQAYLTPDKQQKYLKTIEESGKKLQELINDILDFSQISAGNIILQIEELSLKNLSNKLITVLQEEAQQKNISLELEFNLQEAEDSFFADQERLQKLLLHLLRNALKFTPEYGKVILRVWREYNQAIFQIEDTGIGISEEQISTLFKTFQQLEKSRQRTHGGIGLGLALTKQLVELHQGTIEVESSLDQGSVFTICLPNQSPTKSGNYRQNETVYQPKQFTKKTIILISGDEEIANLVCDLLTADKYQVIWLIDGYLSTRKIQVLEPDLVILDHQLIDTFQISQNLKKSIKMKHIKTLLFHESTISLNWKSLAAAGVDDYLIKPIQPYLLLEKVRYLLSLD